MDGDRLVCFGDDGLSEAVDGTRLTADVRGLASGPPDASFWIRVKDLAPEDVSVALLSDVVGHRPLGRSSDEVLGNLEAMRHSRRLVALEGRRSTQSGTFVPMARGLGADDEDNATNPTKERKP